MLKNSKKGVADLKKKIKNKNKDVNFKLISLEMDFKKTLKKLEERIEALEEKQGKGFFQKLKNRKKEVYKMANKKKIKLTSPTITSEM